ncbi:MAG: hypothetical protein EBW20_11390, partial [Betaproteobacteria bacterium]|nr:hypothetical protein [Betaproteobacteria bacterium]
MSHRQADPTSPSLCDACPAAQGIAAAKQRTSLAAIEAQARAQMPPRDFFGALKAKIAHGHAAVIAEIKKASPS